MVSTCLSVRNRIFVKILNVECREPTEHYTFCKAANISVSGPTGFLHKILALSCVTVGQEMETWLYGLLRPSKSHACFK